MASTSRKTVYILIYYDDASPAVVGVFDELQDANSECLRHAKDAGVFLSQESPTTGPDAQHFSPVEPMRWDTADGMSCWVEHHEVEPKRVVSPVGLGPGSESASAS